MTNAQPPVLGGPCPYLSVDGAAKAAVAEDGRKRPWTPERRAAMSAKMKMQHEANPDTAATRAAALEHGRRALAERRANGAAAEWYA